MISPATRPNAAFSAVDRAALAAIAIVSLVMIVPQQMNWDVSWYIIICERMLDGAIYGVDFIEVNPPAALWLYLGPVAFARAVGISAEAAVIAFTYVVMVGSCWLTWRLLRDDADSHAWAPLFIIIAALMFAILPLRDFAQREHFAQMLLLPYAAIALARIGGAKPAPAFVIAAAVCGGVMASIKPMFVLAAMAPPLTAAVYARNWRLVFAPEACGAAVLFFGYVVAAFLLHPDFFTQSLPLVFSLYTADRWPFPFLQMNVLIWGVGLVVVFGIWAKRRFDAPAPVLFAACSLAFFASYLVQAKGFGYHLMPMLLALVLALAVQWRQTRGEVVRGFLAILVGAVVGAPFVHTPRIDHALLATAIAAEGANVKVMLLGASLPSAHPAAQMAGAQWVSRLPAAWALEAHRRLDGSGPSQQAQVERDRHAAATRAILLEDLRDNRPDVLLVERAPYDWGAELARDREFALQLAHYHPQSAGYRAFDYTVDVLVRRPKLP